MIIKFSVENFRSIDKKLTINFIATKDNEHKSRLINCSENNLNILPSLVIYGANGSGKSNTLLAFQNSIKMIVNSVKYQEGDKLPFNPFKLNQKNLSKTTNFEFVFVYLGVRYLYGFRYNQLEIVEEYLYSFPNGRQTIIFEREKSKFIFKKDKVELKILAKRTLRNRLFIASATEWNYEETLKPFRFLKEYFVFSIQTWVHNENWLSYTINKISSDDNFKKLAINMLQDLNTDILDIEIKSTKKNFTEKDFPSDLPEEVNNLFVNKSGVSTIINTFHKGIEENGESNLIPFSLRNDESKGIQKIFELLGPIIDILQKGKCVIIDELETSLHPLIVKYLVDLFNNPSSNKNNAQLLFTTHDTNLLSLDLFRRDQILFTEKDDNGSTDSYSLSDLKAIRKDENILKGYIRGKYGTIPFITNNFVREF